MPNSNLAKMQMPLAIPSFVEFSTSKSPIRFYEDPFFEPLRSLLVSRQVQVYFTA
jgi:hypothetical protein